MREVTLEHVEVLNETEHIFVFKTIFNGRDYASPVIVNMALKPEVQNATLVTVIEALETMTREDARKATEI